MSAVTDKLLEQAMRKAKQMAQREFDKRKAKAEIHISLDQLAGLLAAAYVVGAIDISGERIEVAAYGPNNPTG